MSYKLVITRDAEEDLVRHRKAGDKKALKRLARILDELREYPTTGFGRLRLPAVGCGKRGRR